MYVSHILKYYQKLKNFTDCSIITFEYFCKIEHNSLINLKVNLIF